MVTATVLESISGNLARVKDQIAVAAERDGRTAEAITLVCVTKYAKDEWVQALLNAGAQDLAESLLPRGAERFDGLMSEGAYFRRHLVGPQQSRKVKLIPGHFDLFQAVDRSKTAAMLSAENEQAGQRQDVLLQVNVGLEEQKHGFVPEQAVDAAGQLMAECPGLRLRGLMAVPPGPESYLDASDFERGSRGHFGRMKGMFDKIRDIYPAVPELDTLSLGMSQDFTWAIEEGATMVRVGSSLFAGLQ